MSARRGGRSPLSPALVAELRRRDPEYRGGPAPRWDPRELDPAAPTPGPVAAGSVHGTAAGIRRHALAGTPMCADCMGLVDELLDSGTAFALCADCGRPMADQGAFRRRRTELRAMGVARLNGHGLCAGCYARARKAATLPHPAPRSQTVRVPAITITASYPVTCAECGLVGTTARRCDADVLRRKHREHHQQSGKDMQK